MSDITSTNGNIRHKADQAIDTGYERAKVGLETARSGAHAAVASTEEAVEVARAYIQDNARLRPLATVATALGAGVLLGLLLRR
jgi:ElaB/YqjD/DUF883 family membrane-anchored ribosome-binding protein